MTDLSHFKKMIEARLVELGGRMQDIETELESPKPKDLGDQAIDLEDDEVLEGIGRVSQKEVALLQNALAEIANGSYGFCKKCGGPISEARLQAVLYAVLCRDCAQIAQSGNG